MTEREQILSKETLRNADIQKLFQVKKSKAGNVIRAIKHYSDRTEIPGLLHRDDYFDYLNRFKKETV